MVFSIVPVFAVLFLQVVSLSLANTKLPPPSPGDYVDFLERECYAYEARDIRSGEYDTIELTGGEVVFRPSDDGWSNAIYANYFIVNKTTIVDFNAFPGNQGWIEVVIKNIEIDIDSVLILKLSESFGWFSFSSSSNLEQVLRCIAVEVNGELRRASWDIVQGTYVFSGVGDMWTPVPEPSTCGAAFSFSALAVGFIRKRKKRKTLSVSLTPSGVPV